MKKYYFLICSFICLVINTAKAQFSDLHNFNGTNGANPFQGCSLTLSGNKLFGMTYEGGINDSGVIFSIDTNGNFYKVLLNFNTANGSYPIGSLTLSGSVLYGMAQYGGAHGFGVIFRIDTNGNNYKDLFDFNGTNGEYGLGTLAFSGAKLFGMAFQGGTNNDGVIFSIDTNGNFYKDILNFNGTNGSYPGGSLILSGAKLFGMTSLGGINDSGVIFSVDTNGHSYKDILNFNGTNGWSPDGSLILSGAELFGMTLRGGATHDSGCIFSIDTNGNFYKDLLDFNGTKGALPIGDVTLSGNILYGMTQRGGAHSDGVIFSIDSNGNSYKDLLDFNGINGYFPSATLTLSGSVMYGMTFEGGTNNDGLIFSFKDTNITTGMIQVNSFADINIYPNPSTGQFTLSLSNVPEKCHVEVYNVLGERVFSMDNAQLSIVNSPLSINLHAEPNGIYLYRVITENGGLVGEGKIIVQK